MGNWAGGLSFFYGSEPTEVKIIDNQQQNYFVYPNPATRELRIENGEWGIENVEIFDIYGRKQKAESKRQKTEWVINISHLPAGVYVLRIDTQAVKVVKLP